MNKDQINRREFFSRHIPRHQKQGTNTNNQGETNNNDQEAIKLNRRNLISSILAVSGAGAILRFFANDYNRRLGLDIARITINLPLYLNSIQSDKIPPEIQTPELKSELEEAKKPNPEKKILWRVFADALQRYNKPVHNIRFEHYVSTLDAITGVISTLPNISFYGVLGSSEQVGEKPFSQSQAIMHNIDEIVQLDPGTGILYKIKTSYKEGFGKDLFQEFQQMSDTPDAEEKRSYVINLLKKWHQDTLKSMQQIAKNSGSSISTSELLTYFLKMNNGNLLQSIWDTTLWLKLTARNNYNANFAFQPTYNAAHLLSELFKDEFSSNIPIPWVAKHIPDGVAGPEPVHDNVSYFANPNYKDFNLINRAGELYHVWNILALSLCADPSLISRMVITSLDPSHYGGVSEHGRVKTEADIEASQCADAIQRIAQFYSQSSH